MTRSTLTALADRVTTPNIAVIANLALVCTGSVLALLGMLDVITGVLIVAIGFAGVGVSLAGQQ